MKQLLLLLVLCSTFTAAVAQNSTAFSVELETIQLQNAPGLQSFVVGTHNGQWLLIGGRTDGLHQRQPFAAFAAAGNNVEAFVVDPVLNQTWSASLATLPTALFEQLQSTNMEYVQRGNTLYVVGGYGYSASSNAHVTHAALTAVDVPGLITAIKNNTSVVSHFRQLTDTRMQVTGGYLHLLGDTFYLAGGQLFEGSYNPMGPNHGPGFVQEYTDAIRLFEIEDDGTNLAIANYSEWVDSANLHRRDYNMVPQRFPDGELGLTLFSGVFQHTVNLPWLNTVDVHSGTYHVRNTFNQYLNQYHAAHMPVVDGAANAMHTVFFGGISRYTLDAQGQLVDDTEVPFVNTISRVTRFSNDSMAEFKDGEMPGLLGSGAAFIPVQDAAFVDGHGMVLLEDLPQDRTLVGYIVGGIESSAPNIFFINTGTQSSASTQVFEVYINTSSTGIANPIDGDRFFTTRLYPNPTSSRARLDVSCPHSSELVVELLAPSGAVVKSLYRGTGDTASVKIPTRQLAPGTYFVRVRNEQLSKVLSLVVQ